MTQAVKPDGARIRKLRKDRKLSVAQLAERVGITRQYLGLVESGVKKQPTLTVLHAIARELKTPLDKLVIPDEEPDPDARCNRCDRLWSPEHACQVTPEQTGAAALWTR